MYPGLQDPRKRVRVSAKAPALENPQRGARLTSGEQIERSAVSQKKAKQQRRAGLLAVLSMVDEQGRPRVMANLGTAILACALACALAAAVFLEDDGEPGNVPCTMRGR